MIKQLMINKGVMYEHLAKQNPDLNHGNLNTLLILV